MRPHVNVNFVLVRVWVLRIRIIPWLGNDQSLCLFSGQYDHAFDTKGVIKEFIAPYQALQVWLESSFPTVYSRGGEFDYQVGFGVKTDIMFCSVKSWQVQQC